MLADQTVPDYSTDRYILRLQNRILKVLTQSYTFVEIDQEIISMVILLLPLSQEGLLSVASESM